MTSAIGYYGQDDEFIALPCVWVICQACEGNGMSSAYMGDVTNWLAEADPDEAESYFAGEYDKPCECCGGSGKVQVANYEKMTAEQTAAYRMEQKIIRDMAREEEAERRFGC